MAKTYSTVEVARMLDVTSDTLHRWIREKKVPAPEAQRLGPFRVRLWTIEDV
jgi:excisionase family DNA binding protein